MIVGDHFHLTYCSNIHPGERWADVHAALAASLPKVRAQLHHQGPFAVGLRLSATAADALEDAETLEAFRRFLRAGDYYVPTINGFPYGAFHGTRVKERVYEPDWRDPRRVEYSNRLARLLAIFLRDARLDRGSVSTVPGAFRARATSAQDMAQIASGILEHAGYLAELHDTTGMTVLLAIEPEPACCIETIEEAVGFFRDYLFAASHLSSARSRSGRALTAEIVRRHIGLCFDACHMAVEFEDPDRALALVRQQGIAIAKVQLSSALRIASAERGTPAHLLAPFAEDTYLHQVVVSSRDHLQRYTDLPDALAAHASRAGDEWRVHFHVPIFLDRMSGFGTTQDYLAALLELLKRDRFATCLEVETYTWDVLPAEYRVTDVCSAISRELAWVREKLTS